MFGSKVVNEEVWSIPDVEYQRLGDQPLPVSSNVHMCRGVKQI